jgi:hypothetical protein
MGEKDDTNDGKTATGDAHSYETELESSTTKGHTQGKWNITAATRDDEERQEQPLPPLSTIRVPKARPNIKNSTTSEKPEDDTDEQTQRSVESQTTVSDRPKRTQHETSNDGSEPKPDRDICPNTNDDELTVRHSNATAMQSNESGGTTADQQTPPIQPVRINPWPKRLKPLIGAIANAMAWKPPKPFDPTSMCFEPTMAAAQHNLGILEDHDFDLQKIITSSEAANTPLRPGSEFRPIEVLNDVFLNHPLWPRVRRTLARGFTMPLRDLPELERVDDVYEALRYGNHKSTHANPEIVLEMLNEEVRYGWQLVLPASSIPKVPGSIVSPLGLVKQTSIDESGKSIVKWRLTHDQSFRFESETSVNSRVEKEKLANCLYGNALRRFIHAIVIYRRRFPKTPLLIAKFDLKSAYRRMHFSGMSALQSIATSNGLHSSTTDTDDLAYVSLRFTFGGSPNPSEFSLISEMIADLSNILLQHRDWNPRELHSEFNSIADTTPKLADESVEFTPARELLNEWEMSDHGVTEAYIDDIFNVFPFLSEDHLDRGRNASLLAIDTLGRPTHVDDPLPRDPLVAIKKLMAEGTPSELMIVLGWQIDTRRLIIQLPEEKATTWISDLDSLIDDADKGFEIGMKRLESIQGRNIHIAAIVPGAMHFHSRMYTAIARARFNKEKKVTRMTAVERGDLRLIRHLVSVAKTGISLNTLVRRMPDHIGRSDAFEGGIGGYDLSSGRAWRYQIQPEDQNQKSQNFLEYLACMTQLVCMLGGNNWRRDDCFLIVGDNTSALGWIRKSNFTPEKDPEQATHLALARHITAMLADFGVTQSGQWRPGVDNGVADTLSRQHDPSDAELTDLIFKSFPEQTPNGFQIQALAPEITSWVRYWVQHTHDTKESPPEPLPRLKCGGGDGSSSYTSARSETTCSSVNSHPKNASSSLEPSLIKPAPANGPCPQKDMITWLRAHAAQPSIACVRPSSQPVGTIPARTRTANLLSFYDANYGDIKMKTRPSNRKKPSLSGCYKK